MPSVAVTRPAAELSLETSLALKVEKSLICLVLAQKPTISIREQLLFLKTLIRN
jgi:hypothetical protein